MDIDPSRCGESLTVSSTRSVDQILRTIRIVRLYEMTRVREEFSIARTNAAFQGSLCTKDISLISGE